ncbi:MAG: hypothetical protein P8J59_03730 [Phycisphaerales bacterium]|jgi:MYXO-CTERM domain-containing protein|nr:hypothetical protein [Phycisphaerales bacterium]
MRNEFLAIASVTIVSAAHAGGVGSTYTDATGDIFDSSLSNIDILAATFNNDSTNLYLSVSVNADVSATDWGKYLVFIDSTPSIGAFSGMNGNDPFNNPWNRRVGSPAGVDAFVGAWIDGDGGNLNYTFDGSAWNQNETGTPDLSQAASGIVSWTFSLASLGLSEGDTFYFDVATTGGSDNDPAIDLLSTDTIQPGWGYNSITGMDLTYTVASSTPVPGIGGIAALAGFGLAGRRRRR